MPIAYTGNEIADTAHMTRNSGGSRQALAIALTCTLALAGCGVNDRKASAGHRRPSVRLTAYAADDKGTSTVILTGAIGDYGTATKVVASGGNNTTGSDQLQLDLQHGKFRLDISAVDRRLADAFARNPINAATCSGHAEVSGSAPIIAKSGSGVYQQIAGTFDLTVTVDEVVSGAPPACDATSPIAAQSVVTTGVGTVQLS